METALQFLGLGAAALAVVVLVWSICVPARRIWPPRTPSRLITGLVWVLTGTLALVVLALSGLGWGQADLPVWLRIGVGLPLLLAGNIVVWREAGRFGAKQTMGAKGELITDGAYRYSRHPQYVADIALCIGWFVLSASLLALPVILAAIVVLALAPYAEEPWLIEIYGAQYRAYQQRVRRFL